MIKENSMNKQKKTMKMDSLMHPNNRIQKRCSEMSLIWYLGETKVRSITRKTSMNYKDSSLAWKRSTQWIPNLWSLCKILTANQKIMPSKMLISNILKSSNILQPRNSLIYLRWNNMSWLRSLRQFQAKKVRRRT
jgi:hypothetical protein